MRRAVLVAIVVLLALLVPARSAAAGSGAGGGPGDPWVWVGQPGRLPGGGADGTGTLTCQLFDGGGLGSLGPILVGTPVSDPVAGQTYILICRDGAGVLVVFRAIVYDPGKWITPGQLAAQAYRQLPLGYPQPAMAPPISAPQLVGVPAWLWLTGGWAPRRATASVPGLSATVTAAPVRAVWRMGDGTSIVCRGPGRPWSPGGTTDCRHTYETDSAARPGGLYVASVEVDWSVSWRSSDGSGGTLPDAVRAARFTLRAVQAQAVVDG